MIFSLACSIYRRIVCVRYLNADLIHALMFRKVIPDGSIEDCVTRAPASLYNGGTSARDHTVTDIDNWLARYEQSYQSLRSRVAYWTSIPLLVLGLTTLLWALPVPIEFQKISPLLNWGSAFLMVTAVYYFIISLSLAIALLPLLLGLAAIQMWLTTSGLPATAISVGLLVAGTVGLILGRGGALRPVLQDIQLIMLAPAWTLSLLFRHFGIPI